MSPKLPTRLLAAQSDRRLVEMVGGGNERAFDALVQRYRRQLLRYCGRMGLSETRADDVLQHAFLQAWLALERGAEVRELKPWLYRVVHNAAVNTMRSSARDHGKAVDLASLESAAVGESELDRRIAVREALTDVAALPRMQREAILMSAVDGRSHREVGSALGVSDVAVRGLLYRARTTLRGAAAALTPQPLLGWISGGASRVATSAGKLVEVSSAAGGSELGGVLMKGAAVAATTVLAAGVVLTPTHHRGGTARTPKLAPRGVTRAEIQSPASATIASSRGEGGRAGLGQKRLVLVSADNETHTRRHHGPQPSGGRHHGDAATALSVSLPTDHHSSGQGRQRTSESSSGSDGRDGSDGRTEGSSQHDGTGDSSGLSASSGSGGGGSPMAQESSHGGAGGEHEGGGSTEDEAEVAAQTAEREAEAARERTEHESEEAQQHEAEGHGGGGRDS